MLNAEHVALQSRLVQQMVAMRQREMDMLLERYNAIGTQSSLLAGFAITSLTALTPSHHDVNHVVTYAFYICSLSCVLSCMHVIMCTMYVCNWAPRLALRGPSGSLQRAFVATKSEKVQINVIFTIAVISFAAQTVCAIWVIDESPNPTPHSVYATVLTIICFLLDVWYHKRIHFRFFGDEEDDTAAAAARATAAAVANGATTAAGRPPSPRAAGGAEPRPTPPGREGSINAAGGLRTRLLERDSSARTAAGDSAPAGGAAGGRRGSVPDTSVDGAALERVAVRDMPMAAVQAHPDVMPAENSAAAAPPTDSVAPAAPRQLTLLSEFDITGFLGKRSMPPSHKGTRRDRATSGLRHLASGLNERLEWKDRFFALRSGRLEYWRSESDYERCLAAAVAPVDLNGYEVLVDLGDHKWGLTLQPATNDGRRVWHLRAPSESARFEWSRRLVLATLTSANN